MVVVGHDEINAELARERGLLHRGDAAVDAHDDLRTVRRELPQRHSIEPVAFLVAVRDVGTHHEAELPEGAHEDG